MNEYLKKKIKDSRIKYYELAKELKCSQATVYRILNDDLSSAKKEQIIQAVNDIQLKRFEDFRNQLKEA